MELRRLVEGPRFDAAGYDWAVAIGLRANPGDEGLCR
jgi:hypothetical protein